MNLKLIVSAVALVAAFGGGFQVATWRADAAQLKVAEQAAKDLKDMTDARDQLAGVLRASADTYESKLRKERNATTALRDSVADGGRLHIAATCPDTSPKATQNTNVDSGAWAELDPAARRAYFALRDGIDTASGQLAACQDQLRLRDAQ